MADYPQEIVITSAAWVAISVAGESGTAMLGTSPSKGHIKRKRGK